MLPVQYEAYGLRWLSQFQMPELQIVQNSSQDAGDIDVHIQSADLTALWEAWNVGMKISYLVTAVFFELKMQASS